ncbi:putative thiol oxidoreductase [Hoeflea phototrophica DFL-43]|jgi:cytochrome c553|uniref:Putative thiol oxidoreductase n=1 Tax=Hoeflea phototrophica (strain DSM 17068 / NCIMB 14078 / DFL-43) TaxID=411684 RepID=A9D0L7_HOEPD|nr:di-heme oxidoredictase family protein [Hoeflea phototrophica]EDQ35021.1 putative thiol oxidoreductase [Hoeflea phototrophica DFL-43]
MKIRVLHPRGLPLSLSVIGAALGLQLAMGAALAEQTDAASSADFANAPWSESSSALGSLDQMPTGLLSRRELIDLNAVGEALFLDRFTTLDGAGRPEATQAIDPTRRKHPREQLFLRTAGPDGGSCAACHNQPTLGGAGDFVTNVFVSEGFESADFDSLDPQFSNERGTNHLFGAGLVELLAREMSRDLQAIRDETLAKARATGQTVRLVLATKGVEFGFISAEPDGSVRLDELDGVDTDLVIRPFSQKGVMTSLRQFTVNALNHHHGMQPDERFGARWTGSDDFDGDGIAREVSDADISALVAWQATLRPPKQVVPQVEGWPAAAKQGETLFGEFGCASCHRPHLPLDSLGFADPGPFDLAGTLNDRQVKASAIYDLELMEWAANLPRDDQGRVLVPLFGDLKRHVMTDNQIDALGNELLSQRFVDRNIFQTTELWGVASTGPYGHRNDFTTLDEIILAHGGSARQSRDAYAASADEDKSALIAFLKTLVIAP